MSDVFQRIAAVHRERIAKAEKTRTDTKKKLARQQAYFKDTGLPAMWDAVKDVKIPNPLPEVIEGLTIPLAALLDTENLDTIKHTGLVFHAKDNNNVEWVVVDNSASEDDIGPKYIYYRTTSGKGFCQSHETPDAKKKFVDSFIKWLAKYITPQMLLEMDIDLDTPSVVKRSRKILQLAE